MKNTKVYRWVGPVLLTIGGVVIMPPLIKKLSAKLYHVSGDTEKIDFANLGPVIERI